MPTPSHQLGSCLLSKKVPIQITRLSKTIRFSEFAHQQKRAAVSLSLRMRSITSQEDLPIARIKEKDAELNFDNGQCLYRVIFCTIKLFLISKIYALRSRK